MAVIVTAIFNTIYSFCWIIS